MFCCTLFLFAVLIPLDEVKAEWERTSGPYHIQRIAEHYGLYHDLFDDAMFVPRVFLRVEYDSDEEYVVPVYHGNLVTPTEVQYQVQFHRKQILDILKGNAEV